MIARLAEALAALGLGLMLILGGGCSSPGQMEVSPERRGTVLFDLEARVITPDLWNPFVPGSRADQGLHQAMIEPLFILNYETGEIEPWLGVSMTSNETLDMWTLVLRPGIAWSDGKAFNADDVVFTVNMLMANAPSLVFSASLAEWVDRVEKVDDLTVRFHLKKPNPRFQLDYWANKIFNGVYIVPEHIWRGKDPLTFKNYDPARGWPVFTGPYRLSRFSETEFEYVRDDNWWGARAGWKPLPRPEKLIWVWYGPEETRTAAMAEGELDCLCDISLGAFQALGHRKKNVFVWQDRPPYAWLDPCSRTLEFNHTRAPWNDRDLRWAVNYAINRDVIVAVAYEGTTLPSRHFFPAYGPLNRYVELLEKKGLYERYPVLKHDPALARQIIESKGYRLNGKGYYEKNGQTLSMTITTHEAYIEKQRIAQVLVEQLQAVGIDASHRNEAGGTWFDNYQFGNFGVQMGWMACGSINEPWSSMDTFCGHWVVPVGERAQANGWRWKNDRYSALVDEMGKLALDDPRIDDLFVEAMEIWLEELPIIPITQAKKLLPFDSTYWTGWPDSTNNYLHPPTWWQSTHKIIHNLEPAAQP
jgi:peptide/nickel transport system substrate-binding protein